MNRANSFYVSYYAKISNFKSLHIIASFEISELPMQKYTEIGKPESPGTKVRSVKVLGKPNKQTNRK
jgi:hypothetical protein